jgi:hypothetical protein
VSSVRTVLLVAATALLLVGVSAAARSPQVRLMRAVPATISGSGYGAREHVVVRYVSGSAVVSKAVVASRSGTFRLVLPGVSFARCAGLSVTAGAARLQAPSCAAGGKPRLAADPGGSVSGAAFVPGERVVVTARPSGGNSSSETVTAASSGRFAVRLSFGSARCAEITFRAVGSLGSTASYVTAAPDCMAP